MVDYKFIYLLFCNLIKYFPRQISDNAYKQYKVTFYADLATSSLSFCAYFYFFAICIANIINVRK